MSTKRKALSMAQSDEEVSSDSDAEFSIGGEDTAAVETPAEKRTRLAKQYLAMVEQSAAGGSDSDADSDAVNADLQVRHQKATSSYSLPLAGALSRLTLSAPQYYKFRSTPTCVSLRSGTAYIGSKSGTLSSLNVSTPHAGNANATVGA